MRIVPLNDTPIGKRLSKVAVLLAVNPRAFELTAAFDSQSAMPVKHITAPVLKLPLVLVAICHQELTEAKDAVNPNAGFDGAIRASKAPRPVPHTLIKRALEIISIQIRHGAVAMALSVPNPTNVARV